MRRAHITVYTRARCGLCRKAEDEVARIARGRADVTLVDVDSAPDLVDRYGVRVPVITVDGEEVSHFEVDRARLRSALAAREGRAVTVAARVALAVHVALAVVPFAGTGLVAPGWAVGVAYAWWALLLIAALVQRHRHPLLTVAVPAVAVATWLAGVTAGDAFLGWTA